MSFGHYPDICKVIMSLTPCAAGNDVVKMTEIIARNSLAIRAMANSRIYLNRLNILNDKKCWTHEFECTVHKPFNQLNAMFHTKYMLMEESWFKCFLQTFMWTNGKVLVFTFLFEQFGIQCHYFISIRIKYTLHNSVSLTSI